VLLAIDRAAPARNLAGGERCLVDLGPRDEMVPHVPWSAVEIALFNTQELTCGKN
jgi:hypothetical protein